MGAVPWGIGSQNPLSQIGKDFIQIVNSSGVFNETYYSDEENLIAKKDNNGKIDYYHPDHLGSTNLVTNESGEVVEETFYFPYGEIIEGGESRFLFTGKEKDKNTELYYYGARYYDSFSKHFIQPDSAIADVYNPQDLNRYSYTRNNPYKYTDPTGETPTIVTAAIGAGIGATIGAVISIASQTYSTGQVSWSDVRKSALTGGIAGGVAGLTFGIGTTLSGTGYGGYALGGAISGFSGGRTGQVTSNVLYGQSWYNNLINPLDIAIETGAGAGLGVAGKYAESFIQGNYNQEINIKQNPISGRDVIKSIETSRGQIGIQSHAIDRMNERGISIDQLRNTIEKGESFNYFHEGSNKLGYYDTNSKIFVGSYNNEITTIIQNANSNYINNLKSSLT